MRFMSSDFIMDEARKLVRSSSSGQSIDHPVEISLQVCEVVPELSHDLCGSAFL
jgi:hypothetical protein